MNTFAARAILYVLFTAHDSGVRLPHAVPNSAGSALWAVREMMWSSGEALMSPHLLDIIQSTAGTHAAHAC